MVATSFLKGADLWIVSLRDSDEVPVCVLKRQEDRARYAQIVPLVRKRQFAFRRAVRDYVLRHYAEHYMVWHEASGKPQLVTLNEPLHFSSSASADVCAIGVSRHAIGVDLESQKSKVDLVDLCKTYLSSFIRLNDIAEYSSFLPHLARCTWCRMEAYIKLYGITLHSVLSGQHIPEQGHSELIVAGENYVCVVSQRAMR